jgi:hypothetical protein
MTDPLTRMAACEIEERYHEYPQAARAMLAALQELAAASIALDRPRTIKAAIRAQAAIVQAKAAGIAADDDIIAR